MMKYLLIGIVIALTVTVSAVDVSGHHVRRIATKDDVENQEQQFRMFVMRQLQQFEVAYTQLQKAQPSVDTTQCVPCSGVNGEYEHSHRGRMLQLFPKLVTSVKTVVQNVTKAVTSTNEVDEPAEEPSTDNFMTLFVESDTGSQLLGGNNSTMGGIFETLLESPLLFLGGIALALVIILPLAILEAISITTATPILCILGFASSLLFGACRRRDLSENEVLRQLVDLSFFTKYFPDGQVRVVDESTDVTSDLRQLVQIGLSPGVIGYLNEVTVSSFVNDIATHNETRPLVSAALIGITPILMLEEISAVTNTPIKCIVADCNNRKLETTGSSSIQELSTQCEIDYFRCQMKKTLMILN